MSGTRAFVVQRVSALYMTLFIPLFLLLVWFLPPADYAAWRHLFATPAMALAVALFFFVLLLHAWVGMRDVILDYVAWHVGVRFTLLALLALGLVGEGLWLLRALVPVVLL